MATKKKPTPAAKQTAPTEAELAGAALARRAYLAALRLATNAELFQSAGQGVNEDLVAELERRVAEMYAPKSP